MFRLNDKAFKILRDEVEKCAAKDYLAGDAKRRIVLKRLEKMRHQVGSRAKQEDLRTIIKDIFPDFSENVLHKAAKANRSLIPLKLLTFAFAGLAGVAGVVWVANLPYPMIRRPVARTAPLLLLPSYFSMDRNYREAIAHVEQADQLINKATSLADFELGEQKVKIARKNLDALPVWFLGYEPQLIRTLYNFSWKFTFDEFEAARKSVGRMEATIFQQKNAMSQLETSEATLQQAKQNYKGASTSTEKQAAISAWQTSMDELAQIPPATLAGKMAKTKLKAYQRDFRQVSGLIAGNNRTNNLIGAAKQFAFAAAQMGQNPPHNVTRWQQCENMWKLAIQRLQSVPLEDPGYLEAQSLLATYSNNLATIQIRRQAEANSVRALEQAEGKIQRLLASTPTNANSVNRNLTMSQLQGIINQLRKVQTGTTAYTEAQTLLKSAENKLKQL
ncbi:MAG: hypothetical protein F6K10_17460 [Moorea sp. SIO2B7]|nr:hypothetical protein [Moorena sp. SIO2B7]